MALFRKLFYRKPPDRLLEIAERVYGMFPLRIRYCSCCFSSFSVGFLKLRERVTANEEMLGRLCYFLLVRFGF